MELSLKAIRKDDTPQCSIRSRSIEADLHKAIEKLEKRLPGSAIQIDEQTSTEEVIYFVLSMPGHDDRAAINAAFSGVFVDECLDVRTTFPKP